ncbi:hypothetical protein COS75_02385 [Candidatus Pacearchaeota archaeon CG06_land_8_20_14_3_00_35_12]|nr:MAG: hypothetical protein COS75_02385 [Candidatus Pacearchaeota archaeon CG06_land_8_20_14_3_00_35_12]
MRNRIYAKILTRKGAKVKGIDISEEMIKIARQENPEIEFKIGSADNLPYKNKEFDVVLSALAVEYFPNWDKLFKEVNRVLKDNGLFVFSTGNPVINAVEKEIFHGRKFREVKNYFREGLRQSRWHNLGKKGELIYTKWYHRTYGSIVRLIIKNGFELIDYEDAYPLKKAEKLFPKDYKIFSNMPYFCTWKARKK